MTSPEFSELRDTIFFPIIRVAQYLDAMELQIQALHDTKSVEVEQLVREGRLSKDFTKSYKRDFELTMRRNFLYSYIVLLYLLTENGLRFLCDQLYQDLKLPVRAKDIKGDGFESCTTFLVKLVNLSPKNIPEWQKVTDLAKVRNCIVHTAGRIEDSKDQPYLRLLCRQGIGLDIDRYNPDEYLSIEPRYCRLITGQVFEFFNRVMGETWYTHYDNASK